MIINAKIPAFNIRSLFFFITYPIQYSFTSIGKYFVYTINNISKIRELEKELADYKEKMLKFQENLLLFSQVIEENQELKKALNIKSKINYTTIYANVISRDPSLLGDYFIIDKGLIHGVKENMPVVSYDSDENIFLVGKISEVNVYASKVKLITSDNFYIGVTLKNSGYIGVLKGEGSWSQNCVIDYIPVESSTFLGEEVITSGESDIYPKGIRIGVVVNIEKNVLEEFFIKLHVKPYIKYSKIKDVFIINWTPSENLDKVLEKLDE